MSDPGPRLSSSASEVRTSVFAALAGRIEAQRTKHGRLIPLQIGDTHLAPPAAALDAARGLEPHDLGVYGAVAGLPELGEAVAARLMKRGLSSVRGSENVLVGAGCTHALFCGARALLDPGDEVLVAVPYWPLIPGVLRAAGLVPVEVPLTTRLYADPHFDVRDAFERAVTPRTRALYFSSPNNPDGYVLGARELAALGELAAAHDLWVLADEVYSDFAYEGAHTSIANLAAMADRTITAHSLSKSHALAGARIGSIAGPKRVIDAARRISNHTIYNVPVTMQRAAIAALSDGDAWLGRAKAAYLEARDRTTRELDRRGLVHHRPRGGSFVFLDLAERLGGAPLTRLLELAIDEGVLLAPGDAFGRSFECHARLCFTGTPIEDVIEGVARFDAALDKLK